MPEADLRLFVLEPALPALILHRGLDTPNDGTTRPRRKRGFQTGYSSLAASAYPPSNQRMKWPVSKAAATPRERW